MTFVSTMANTKDERIYIRVSEDIRDEFDAVAEYRGLTRSGLLHSLIVRTIHETKKEAPEIFDQPRIKRKSLDEVKGKAKK